MKYSECRECGAPMHLCVCAAIDKAFCVACDDPKGAALWEADVFTSLGDEWVDPICGRCLRVLRWEEEARGNVVLARKIKPASSSRRRRQ